MFVAFKDSQRYVYHYTRLDIARDHILPNNSLKINCYTKTNDPKETKDWSFSAGTNEQRDLMRYDLATLSKRMTEALKKGTSVICFSMDRPLTGDYLNEIYKRGFCKPRMWAQYAGNHTGVCLIFERDALSEQIRRAFGHLMVKGNAVTYRNRPGIPNLQDGTYAINVDYLEQVGEEQYVRAHIETHWRRLFFEKAEDWSGEDEFRWVVFGSDGSELFFDIGKTLHGIIFGASCTEDDIRSVVRLCQGRPLWYEQLEWKGCTPWVTWLSARIGLLLRNS